MKLTSTINDNVTELLSKILEFTQRRRVVLTTNITNVNAPGYEPMDLDVEGFTELMTWAITEHMQSKRLMLCDSDNIKFGPDGFIQMIPIPDENAKRLLAKDTKGYLEEQVSKLAENLLNHKVATEMLNRKQSRSFFSPGM